MILRLMMTALFLFLLTACGYEVAPDEQYDREFAEIDAATQGVHHASGLAKIYADLSAKGNTEAMVMLGNAYLYEEGVAFNPDKAMELFNQAAKAGNFSAAGALSTVYAEGIQDENGRVYVAADLETSLMWMYVSMAQVKAGFIMEKIMDTAIEEGYKESGVDIERAKSRAAAWLKDHKKS